MHIKQVAGKITQIMTPIVDPTNPSTSSMFGISTPTKSDATTIVTVNILNFRSGM